MNKGFCLFFNMIVCLFCLIVKKKGVVKCFGNGGQLGIRENEIHYKDIKILLMDKVLNSEKIERNMKL